MLVARGTAVRNVSRIARRFATVVESSGVKIAATDNGEATSSVTFLVKAGTRFESKPGVAHALQNFAFKSTSKRSALGTVRESELYGGVLSSSVSREYLAFTADFLKGDEPFFVDVLSSFLTDAKFTRHELTEYVTPVCNDEAAAASHNNAFRALEIAHTLAFRNGLGAPLYQSDYAHISADSVKEYAFQVFTKGNIAVLGSGISQDKLSALLEKSLASLPAASASTASTTTAPSSYFGGETRVSAHHGPQTVFVGFGVAGSSAAPSPALSVLAAHLSTEPHVKWSEGLSGLPQSVSPVYLPYSDAGLFGFVVRGKDAEEVRSAGKAAVAALKAGVQGDAVKRAVAKAKFAAAAGAESRSGLVATVGGKILAGSSADVKSTLSAIEAVDASAISKTISALLKAKPTYVTVGDIQTLPYADELGL